MGESQSKSSKYNDAIKLFTTEEQKKLNDIVANIFNDKQKLSADNFERYIGSRLFSSLTRKLFSYMVTLSELHAHAGNKHPSKGSSATKATEKCISEEFVIMLSQILMGTVDEKATVISFLACENIHEPATAAQLVQFLEEILASCQQMLSSTDELKSWDRFEMSSESIRRLAMYQIQFLINSENKPTSDKEQSSLLEQPQSIRKVASCLASSRLLPSLLDSVFRFGFSLGLQDQPSLLPLCMQIAPPGTPHGNRGSLTSHLLDAPSLLLLNAHLPFELRRKWRLLFDNVLHGESFVRIVKHVLDQGPSLVVLQDSDGHVFGGFAGVTWSCNANFIGNEQCFLFTLKPNMRVYHASGQNQNYLYLNHNQQTVPNGMAFGGQFGHHGLFIDSSYGVGHSRALPLCSTYDSPRLSGTENFKIVALEVWGCGRIPNAEEQEEGEEEETKKKGSILDKDPGATAILKLIGKGPRSEGIREYDARAHTPEEEHLY